MNKIPNEDVRLVDYTLYIRQSAVYRYSSDFYQSDFDLS